MRKSFLFFLAVFFNSFTSHGQHANSAGGINFIFQTGTNQCEDLMSPYPLAVVVNRCYDSSGNYCSTGVIDWYYRRVSQNTSWQPIGSNWINYGDYIEKNGFVNMQDSGEVRMIFTDTSTMAADTFDIYVFTPSAPNISFVQDSINCSGIWYHAIDLNNPSGIGNIYDYNCDGGVDANISCYSASASFNAGADVSVCVENSYGCYANYAEIGWFNADYLYDINPNIITNSNTFCAGSESFNLERINGLSAGIPSLGWTYEWFLNGNLIPNSNVFNYYPTLTGSYYVRITNSIGCQFTSNPISVTILQVSNTVTADGSTTFCAGSSVNLTSDVVDGTYQWKKNGVSITTNGTSRTYKARANGSYTCVVTNACGSTTTNAIQVTTKTNASATVSASGATSFCAGDSVTLNCTNLGSNYTVQWYRTNVSIENATAYTQVVKQPGTYKVVTKNITNGCSRISGSSAVVAVSCRLANPDAISVSDENEEESKSIDEAQPKTIRVFPNPNSGSFTFEYQTTEEGTGELQILNVMGQSIYNSTVTVVGGIFQQQIDLGYSFLKGIYIVRFTLNGVQHDRRLVLQ